MLKKSYVQGLWARENADETDPTLRGSEENDGKIMQQQAAFLVQDVLG